jgi:hypothetical protein
MNQNQTAPDRILLLLEPSAYMNINQIAAFCRAKGWNQNASYIESFRGDEDRTFDTDWLDKKYVIDQFGLECVKEMECTCTTWCI